MKKNKKRCKNTKKIRTQKINRNWANESVIDAKYIKVVLVGHMQGLPAWKKICVNNELPQYEKTLQIKTTCYCK